MKNKGFTLVELLATILVIGIIILIAIPIAYRIFIQAREESFKNVVSNIISVIEKECESNLQSGEETIKRYVFTANGVEPKIDIKGRLPISGYIETNESCRIEITDLSNGKITASKKFESSGIIYDVHEGN